MKLVDALDVNHFEIKNAVIQVLAAAPTNPAPVIGQLYYDSLASALKVYDGQVWKGAMGGGGAAGATTLSGEASGSAVGAEISVTLNGLSILAKPLTGLDENLSGAISAVDSIIAAFSKVTNRLAHTPLDTGTSSPYFQINSGNAGPRLKHNGAALEVRNAADNAYADLVVNNLTVKGATTQIDSVTMNIGDNEVILNSESQNFAGNVDGGVTLKRFSNDGIRRDAKIRFNNAMDRWEVLFGPTNIVPIARKVAMVHTETIGNGYQTLFNITHMLGNDSPMVAVTEASGNHEQVTPRVTCPTPWEVNIEFSTPPATGAFYVTVIG